jgi:hypothetical protein
VGRRKDQGVTVNGVYFSGWLYWHLNHWKIRIDDIDEYGNDIRIESYPELRDNEWIRAETLEQNRESWIHGNWKARRKIRNGSIIFWYECHHVQEYTKCYVW